MTQAEKLYEKIANELGAKRGAAASQMFGMPTMKINGKAFAGLVKNAMTFKLTGAAHKKALSLKGAKLFDPMGGRPMKEWVQVPLAQSKEWARLAEQALEYVTSKTK